MDRLSWSILLEDFETVLDQLRRGVPVDLGSKTSSFREWAVRMAAYAGSGVLGGEYEYWRITCSLVPEPLPRCLPEGTNLVRSARTVCVSLERDDTAALFRALAACRAEINDLLVTALVQAFALWTGQEALLVELEGHGREPLCGGLDLSRTLGWFTSRFPVWLDLEGAADPGAAIRTIKEQLRAIPNHGVGYGLLRHFGPEEIASALRAGAEPEVSFNYLGQVESSASAAAFFELLAGQHDLERDPNGERRHLIAVDCTVRDGRFSAEWTYSSAHHEHSTMVKLAQGYVERLRLLVTHCLSAGRGEYTPSDFANVDLDQKGLDSLLAQLG
jgi:non-ribosomal peptide synthase protein (TIGR01720 family)